MQKNCSKEDVKEKLIKFLSIIHEKIQFLVYNSRVGFIQNVISSDNITIRLFGEGLTMEFINKRFRELSLHFHPDKAQSWIKPEHRFFSDEFFIMIRNLKEELMTKFPCKIQESWAFHTAQAEENWRYAVDYRQELKKKTNVDEPIKPFSKLKQEDIKDKSVEEIKILMKHFSQLAFDNYASLRNIADDQEWTTERIHTRINLAACCIFKENLQEAKLYALSALYISTKLDSNVHLKKTRAF
jgi:hypothetical protein